MPTYSYMACSLMATVCSTLGEGLVAPAGASANIVGWSWFGAGAASDSSDWVIAGW